jgi:hypothetical protein
LQRVNWSLCLENLSVLINAASGEMMILKLP